MSIDFLTSNVENNLDSLQKNSLLILQVKELDIPYRASRVVPRELWEEVMETVPKVFFDGFRQN